MSGVKTAHVRKDRSHRGARQPERDAAIPASFAPVKPRDYGTTKEIVGRAIAKAGGVPRVMALLDRSQSVVYGYCDPQAERCDLSLDQARKLAEFAGAADVFAEDFAKLAGGAFLPAPKADEKESWAAVGALCGKDGAAFQAQLLHALQDGAVSKAERASLERDIDRLIAAAIAARIKLKGGAP